MLLFAFRLKIIEIAAKSVFHPKLLSRMAISHVFDVRSTEMPLSRLVSVCPGLDWLPGLSCCLLPESRNCRGGAPLAVDARAEKELRRWKRKEMNRGKEMKGFWPGSSTRDAGDEAPYRRKIATAELAYSALYPAEREGRYGSFENTLFV